MKFIEKNVIFDWFNIIVFTTIFIVLMTGCSDPFASKMKCKNGKPYILIDGIFVEARAYAGCIEDKR